MRIPTVEPGFCSFKRRACSRAFKSSGLKMAGRAARFTVPSAVMASLPTFRVSGTCLASTTIFKAIIIINNVLLSSKSGAKVRLFTHTAKQIAQNRPKCAQNVRFVQSISCRFDNDHALDSIFFVCDGQFVPYEFTWQVDPVAYLVDNLRCLIVAAEAFFQ